MVTGKVDMPASTAVLDIAVRHDICWLNFQLLTIRCYKGVVHHDRYLLLCVTLRMRSVTTLTKDISEANTDLQVRLE
jgi:hypothetical protein